MMAASPPSPPEIHPPEEGHPDMVESRWLRWFAPGVVALAAVGLVASTTLGAGDRPWAPRACPAPGAALIDAARRPGPSVLADLRGEPWYRMDPVLDRDGASRAQRLIVGVGAHRIGVASEAANESFVAGPFGRVLLVGTDDGSASRLVAYDVAADCAWTIAAERDVVRRATVDPASASVYETRVSRLGRVDLGIWRRPLDGSGPAVPVLAPLPADDRFGPTFSTEFTWDPSGSRLAVQTCGEFACRTRFVVGPAESAATIADPEAGLLIGVDGDDLVQYGACRGFPCPVVVTDRATGTNRVLEPIARRATLVPAVDGARLVVEGDGGRLRALRIDGSDAIELGSEPAGLQVVGPGSVAGSGMRVPPGWILLGPDGRLPDDRTTARPQLRRIQDGTTVQLDEVAP
jgi:hypothetical protein